VESLRLLVEHPEGNLRPRVQHPSTCNRFLNIGATGLPRKTVAGTRCDRMTHAV
jgi:hypothetical protein